MKFGIDIGHNCPPKDTGAVGIKKEDDLTKDVGTRLIQKLTAAGHSVINCTPSQASTVGESLQKRVNKANSNQVDIFVSIHFNAFSPTANPRGTEIYAVSNAGKAIAQSVLSEIVLVLTDFVVNQFSVIFDHSLSWQSTNCSASCHDSESH